MMIESKTYDDWNTKQMMIEKQVFVDHYIAYTYAVINCDWG